MSTPTPPPRSPAPLTPEERALAARLVRLGPHGMPPPALDAGILRAAHAAAASHAPARPRRWPALLGLAATLALAIGVTWQMQPTMESAPHGEAPRADAPTASADASGDPAAAAATAAEAGSQTVPPTAQAQPAPEPQRTRGPAAPVTAPAPPVASVLSAPPPPPAPPSAAPASAPAPQVAAEKSLAPAAATRATQDSTAPRMQDSAATQSVVAREGVADAAGASAPVQDLAGTPVESDRELAPAQWLERIRLRRDAGDLDGARASLQLLRSAYPQLILPDDLRALAADQGDLP